MRGQVVRGGAEAGAPPAGGGGRGGPPPGAPSPQADISTWQFLHSPKLRARIVPWAEAGVGEQEVDEGDYLLDWRRGGRGLRYVHHTGEEEVARLAEPAGLRVSGQFHSDGEGGRLGL